ncbi:MAG: hypothetical protein ACR2JQ_11075 [Mycobacteriales bacterium]
MAFLPVVAAAGCHPGNRPTAESTGFAGTAVEGTIEGALAAQLRHKDMTTGQAHCPATVNPTTAKAAYCALDVEGQSARIKVTRRGAGFVVRTDQVIVNVAALEAQGERQLKQRYLLDCGAQAVRVLNVKGTLRCLATPHRASRSPTRWPSRPWTGTSSPSHRGRISADAADDGAPPGCAGGAGVGLARADIAGRGNLAR